MIPLSQLIHMAVTDKTLRAELAADPATALRGRGLQVSPEVLQALEHIRPLMAHSSQSLGMRLPSHIDETGEDWGRHLDASSITYAATQTIT
jgi:hypothetical protein